MAETTNRKAVRTAAVVILLAAMGMLYQHAQSASGQQIEKRDGLGAAPRWEYKFIHPDTVIGGRALSLGQWGNGNGLDNPKLEQAANDLGAQGFELILVDQHGMYFRRQK